MAVREILRWPDPRLMQVCAPVGDAEVATLVSDLFETMYAAPGRGLAAPQVGELVRVFVMDIGWKTGTPTPRAIIDPEIVERAPETAAAEEACLSIPGVSAMVTRPARVTVRWRDLTGARRTETLTGAEAVCAQHEYDHLDGRVIFDRLDDAERSALLTAYGGAA